MSKSRLLIAASVVGSGLVILASIIAIIHLFNEINSFYYDILHEMDEFKIFTDQKSFYDCKSCNVAMNKYNFDEDKIAMMI
uniref:Col_cuticle_N domain-containing protein n=1 Tax=Ascaris lumbricoides TaxID=6252 RepID=A0A0M3IJ20_ASCLU